MSLSRTVKMQSYICSVPRRDAEVCSIPDRDEAADEVAEAD